MKKPCGRQADGGAAQPALGGRGVSRDEDAPTCGACGREMTRANSTAAPELFLCDACAAENGCAPPPPAAERFCLSPVEQERFVAWDAGHYHDCKFFDDGSGSSKTGAIGGRLTFCFTVTSIGVVAVVRCACGAEADVTDFSAW